MLTELEIVCLPRHLPEYIEVDVKDLELNQTVHLADIQVPEGVEIAALQQGGDPAQPVVSVQVPRAIIEPEEEAIEAAEGDEEAPSDDDATDASEDESSSGDEDQN